MRCLRLHVLDWILAYTDLRLNLKLEIRVDHLELQLVTVHSFVPNFL
jgi:hypothetical protein